ncbi:MAG: hypothetical protein GWP04_02835 [Gammaproteobacteria bacterium]|nr:hypothetical protein [Gammaproteobacteria bacterium]
MTRGSRVAILAVVGLVVVGAVLVTNVLPIRSLVAEQRRVELAREQLSALQEANARLQASAEFLSSDAGVEMVARRDFGLVRPGETAYVVVDPDDKGFTPEVPKTAVKPEQPRPWWQQVWDFVTGHDLTG